jgi:hypothetical protein
VEGPAVPFQFSLRLLSPEGVNSQNLRVLPQTLHALTDSLAE